MIVWFPAASVTEACGEHDEHEGERVRTSSESGQDEYEDEAEGREDAVDQTQERGLVVWSKHILTECHQGPCAGGGQGPRERL